MKGPIKEFIVVKVAGPGKESIVLLGLKAWTYSWIYCGWATSTSDWYLNKHNYRVVVLL